MRLATHFKGAKISPQGSSTSWPVTVNELIHRATRAWVRLLLSMVVVQHFHTLTLFTALVSNLDAVRVQQSKNNAFLH